MQSNNVAGTTCCIQHNSVTYGMVAAIPWPVRHQASWGDSLASWMANDQGKVYDTKIRLFDFLNFKFGQIKLFIVIWSKKKILVSLVLGLISFSLLMEVDIWGEWIYF